MSKQPTVSVITITYNQEAFIRQTLESLAMQKTDFKFEVLVSDDRSTDKTPSIVDELAKKYPTIIKPMLRQKNLGAMPNFVDTLKRAQGEYVALCEGDDYWTDADKLQKQVDFLKSHKEHALCFHPVKIVFEGGEEPDAIYPKSTRGFTLEELLKRNFIQTNSVMYRRQKYDNLPTDIIPGDWYLHLYHAQFGKIGFINEVMSVYRRHPGGIWWDQHSKPQMIWQKYGYSYLRLLHEIMLLYGDNADYRKIISHHIAGSYEAIASVRPQEVADDIATKSIAEMPAEAWGYMQHLMQQVDHYSKHDAYLQSVLDTETLHHTQAREHILRNEQQIKLLQEELSSIKQSRGWKAVQAAARAKRLVHRIRPARTKHKKEQ